MISILIVDDHELVRDGMRLILETESRYMVIGEVSNGQEALTFLKQCTPDIILLDLNMPILDGLSFLKAIKQLEQRQDLNVIVLTTYNEERLVQEAIKLGAKGFLLKGTGRKNLFHTIDAVMGGETLVQQRVPEPSKEMVSNNLIDLNKREIFILEAIAKGDRSKDIASKLNIAERTVKANLTKIYNKLGVNSRAEAVAMALEKKYISIK